MSWSFSAEGYPKAVAQKVREAITSSPMGEPEQTIKEHTLGAVRLALTAYPDDFPVAVLASGSQSTEAGGKAVNQLRVEINPVWNFVK